MTLEKQEISFKRICHVWFLSMVDTPWLYTNGKMIKESLAKISSLISALFL